MWLRHDVDTWHLDCEIRAGEHDFIAALYVKDGKLLLSITGESRQRSFNDRRSLNEYLARIGLEELQAEV